MSFVCYKKNDMVVGLNDDVIVSDENLFAPDNRTDGHSMWKTDLIESATYHARIFFIPMGN